MVEMSEDHVDHNEMLEELPSGHTAPVVGGVIPPTDSVEHLQPQLKRPGHTNQLDRGYYCQLGKNRKDHTLRHQF